MNHTATMIEIRRQTKITLEAQRKHYAAQAEYDLIRPFCPVCSHKHAPGSPRAYAITPHGVANCQKCQDKIWPVPLGELDPEKGNWK
jgi:hypothetical protein